MRFMGWMEGSETMAKQPIIVVCPYCKTRLQLVEVPPNARRALCAKCNRPFPLPERTGGPEKGAGAVAKPPRADRAKQAAGSARPGPVAAGPVRRPSVPRDRSASSSGSEQAEAAAPRDSAAGQEEAEVYPWEPDPALLARTEQFEERGEVEVYNCRCGECLNVVTKEEALAMMPKAELRIYPDLVAVTGRASKWGCLLMVLALPGLVVAGPLFLLLAIPELILKVVLMPYSLLKSFIVRLRLRLIAWRIRRNPRSSYAIKAMYELTGLAPRVWQRGDIVQVLRVNVRRFLCGERRLVMLVADNPLPAGFGCMEMLLPYLVGRRRIYMLHIPGDRELADRVAEKLAAVFGVEVTPAGFGRKRLKLPGSAAGR